MCIACHGYKKKQKQTREHQFKVSCKLIAFVLLFLLLKCAENGQYKPRNWKRKSKGLAQ